MAFLRGCDNYVGASCAKVSFILRSERLIREHYGNKGNGVGKWDTAPGMMLMVSVITFIIVWGNYDDVTNNSESCKGNGVTYDVNGISKENGATFNGNRNSHDVYYWCLW